MNRSVPGVLNGLSHASKALFFSFKKIDIPKFKMYVNTSALLIFGNTPMKILVLVIKVRIIDVSVDRTSIFASKCMQPDKLTRQTPATTG